MAREKTRINETKN